MIDTKPPNAFSSQYVSQILPFKPGRFKLPALVQPAFPVRDSIAASEDGKRARLLKALI